MKLAFVSLVDHYQKFVTLLNESEASSILVSVLPSQKFTDASRHISFLIMFMATKLVKY